MCGHTSGAKSQRGAPFTTTQVPLMLSPLIGARVGTCLERDAEQSSVVGMEGDVVSMEGDLPMEHMCGEQSAVASNERQ